MRPFLDEMALILLTVWAEARGESLKGKAAVCEVIRNRTIYRYESDGTIPGTILHPLAFSCWNAMDRQRVRMAKISLEDPVVQECLEAWTKSEDSDYSKGALHYFNPRYAKKPASFGPRLARIGHHDFHSPS